MSLLSHFSKNERELIAILSLELTRDGGSCRAIPLKEFAGDKKVDAFLEGKKFLLFLEDYPEIFCVDRTSQVVTLKTFEFVFTPSEEQEKEAIRLAENNLEQRVVYVLRQLEAKQVRRRKQRATEGKADERPGASLEWLTTKCSSHLHQWTRLFRDIHNSMHHQQINDDFLSTFNNFLSERHHIFQLNDQGTFVKWTLVREEIDDRNLSELANELVLAAVAGGVSLSQLLHYNTKLRQFLGGRDLCMLIEEYPLFFGDVEVFHDKKGHLYIKKCSDHFSGRLEVDEVAQFSVTASKHSAAMATCLFQAASRRVDASNNLVAIDMTAGAGGITLALAKRFTSVTAIDIDAGRAELCRINMKSHGRDNVTIVCADAMEFIVQGNCTSPIAVMIDPPWGGLNYRRDCQNIGLGKNWPLTLVLTTLVQKLIIFCVGLKLPLTFDINKLVNDANDGCEGGHVIKISFIKKLGPQLFVLLETLTDSLARTIPASRID